MPGQRQVRWPQGLHHRGKLGPADIQRGCGPCGPYHAMRGQNTDGRAQGLRHWQEVPGEDSAPQLGWPALTTSPRQGPGQPPRWAGGRRLRSCVAPDDPTRSRGPVFTSLNHRGEKSCTKHLPGI